MIEFNALSFKYPQSHHKVLDQVTLEIPPGSLTLVTGASGSGKSTLLRCINGLVPHFSGGTIAGQIRVFGLDPISEGVEVMAGKVGIVFQEPEAQFVSDSVEDEIVFSLENMGLPRAEMDQRLLEVLQELHLMDLRNKRVNEISGGEKQKVAIASALVAHPKVLILDEPTSQLDPISADELLKFIIDLQTRLNLTVLISEHRLERLLPYADLMINLTADQGVNYGTPQEILSTMVQVPPIIEIARKLGIKPLPLTPETFPNPIKDTLLPPIRSREVASSAEREPVLTIEHLSTSLNDEPILKDICLDLRQGEILVLMGPNGAGKTTLLRSILKLIPSSGDIYLDKNNIKDLHLSDIILKIAYLPQNPNDLLFAESIIDELEITLKNHSMEMNKTEIAEFLDHFDLREKGHRYPRDLSVGERQRTALAAITVHQPQIIFLDEPTRGLDYRAKRTLSDLFHQWRDQGKALLLVTHDVEFAAHLADRVVLLEVGKIIFNGEPITAFTQFPAYQTQTARIYPGRGWIVPEDVILNRDVCTS